MSGHICVIVLQGRTFSFLKKWLNITTGYYIKKSIYTPPVPFRYFIIVKIYDCQRMFSSAQVFLDRLKRCYYSNSDYFIFLQ